ncbi:MAG: YjjG family noncanonical pyrimidine nucleotidase [Bacteroidales bacterium]|nr:YjjG family noncanonical pyrimidine nucleotidase [Bacteroidales bacterium]
MAKYINLFFDLDRTLWDFDQNNRNSLFETYHQFDFDMDFETFFSMYKAINKMLWDAYGRGEIKKELLHVNRFYLTFKALKIDNLLMATEFAEVYSQNIEKHNILMPHAKEILEFLKPNFKLYIVTNGFKEFQHRKLRNSGTEPFFDGIFISETIGYHKPHLAFFEHVLKITGAKKDDSLIIGDDMRADIQGAKNAGIACVLYNPTNENDLVPDYRIGSLLELKGVLNCL